MQTKLTILKANFITHLKNVHNITGPSSSQNENPVVQEEEVFFDFNIMKK